MPTDLDPLAEIRETFFVECEELLENLQDGLQAFETDHDDLETINIVFRAVHSIKGGAGAFGFEELVEFSHGFETVLDHVRAGALKVDADILALFHCASDILGDLVRAEQTGIKIPPQVIEKVSVPLASLASETGVPETEDFDFAPLTLSLDDIEYGANTDEETALQAIKFKPRPDLYATGNEPLFVLGALEKIENSQIRLDYSNVPPLANWVEDETYLEWDLAVPKTVPQSQVDEIFDFVADVCEMEFSTGLPDPQPAPSDVETGLTNTDSPPIPPVPKGQNSPPSQAKKPMQAPENATIRVGLGKVDKLMNLVTELVVNQAMLNECLQNSLNNDNAQLERGLDELNRLSRDLQDSVMSIRAQPVKPLFQRMGRIAREASTELGKPVKFQTSGEETEVDRTVIERLVSPLTHMLRNAIDHGLEDCENRVQAGKPAEGSVSLTAAHKAGRVIIEVSDDGAGLDRAKIREKAIKNGLIADDAHLSEGEIDNLLFLPGFSTAEQVSSLSGRGVGMDVVKTSIEALGGRISISSLPGEGTNFRISLPLTLAVLDGMVIRIAEETMVMPLSAIAETLLIDKHNLRHISADKPVIDLRGTIVPLVDLGVALGLRCPKQDYLDSIVLIIALDHGAHLALVVDEIIEQRQVVIKGLGRKNSQIPGVAAATILGDGQIALILDPLGILQGPKVKDVSSNKTLEQAI